jgi:hypothetical protein
LWRHAIKRALGTNIHDPDGWHVKFIDGFVVLFMVPYPAVIVLHRKVWIPTTILIYEIRWGQTKVSGREREMERASGEEIFTLRILRSITAWSSQIDSARENKY